MPRTYKRKTEIAKWSKRELDAAIKSIKEGWTITTVKGAAERYSIPRTTLITGMKNNNSDEPKLGRYRTLTEQQENELAHHIILLHNSNSITIEESCL